MSADLYRDASLGLRARLAELDARIREREAEVTELFWESIPPPDRVRMIAERKALEVSASATFEELSRAENALTAYAEELERRIGSLPAMEAAWLALPDEAPDPPAPEKVHYGSLAPRERDEVEAKLRASVKACDAHGEVVFAHQSGIARFTYLGTPFGLRATAYRGPNNSNLYEVEMTLATGVPRAAPALVVRHESLVLSVAKALGLKHEVEIGDPSFDGLFLIEATREAAKRLLPNPTCAYLLTLARYDVPTLIVDPPSRTASITWSFEPVGAALDAAAHVLAAIRRTEAEVRFRR